MIHRAGKEGKVIFHSMKILVVQLGKIGDMVLTTPLFRAIHREFPEARIHVLLSRRGAPVVAENPRIEKIILYRKNPLRLISLFMRLRLARYDFLIDPKDHYSTESAILARVSRAAVKVGFNSQGRRKNVFTRSLPGQEENFFLHAVERNLLPLGFLGIPPPSPSDKRPELFPSLSLLSKIRENYVLEGASIILLNLSTGDACRRWEAKKWAEVAEFCLERNFQVFLSFQPSDCALAEDIHTLLPETTLFRSDSIREVIALIPHVRLVVTPDTSIVHIASAFNIPQIALFPPVEWNLHKFKPLSDRAVVLQPPEGAAPATIRAGDVIEAMENLLQLDQGHP
jgi:heptosyltransferase III